MRKFIIFSTCILGVFGFLSSVKTVAKDSNNSKALRNIESECIETGRTEQDCACFISELGKVPPGILKIMLDSHAKGISPAKQNISDVQKQRLEENLSSAHEKCFIS